MNNEQYGKDEMDEIRKALWTAAHQTEVPDSRPKSRAGVWFISCCVMAYILVIWYSTTHGSQIQAATAAASMPGGVTPLGSSSGNGGSTGATVVRATYWCGTSLDDAMRVAIAVRDNDIRAVAGLISRGDAFQVEGGTRVYNTGVLDYGISVALIESGFQSGRKCYIPTNALR